MRKVLLISMLVAGIIVGTGMAAVAYEDIESATIVQIGTFYNQATVRVTATGLTGSPIFYLDPTKESEQLATLLTAFSLEKTVWMRVAATTNGSLVQVVYINP